MLFNSFIFWGFFSCVIVSFRLVKPRFRNLLLVIASYLFYGYWDWRFCGLLVISTLVDFFVGRWIHQTEDRGQKRRFLLLSLCVNLGILSLFKYANFFLDSFVELAEIFGFSPDFLHLHLILPVGISFYTFQTMSYTIDIYKGKIEPTERFMDFALFVSFFPQLVAGPIERAATLLPQLGKELKASHSQIRSGIDLIIIGLFKKVMIGDACGRVVDQIFAQPDLYASIELLMALILFSIQIYADFSGYSSIARGLSKLLGIELMRNFEQPYLSRNITEFWRRWHISLSSWLKDYLYISLGGNRKGSSRTYVNLMITMLLGGLWHGASWNFVIWGGLHGVYLGLHKLMLGGGKGDLPNISSSILHKGISVIQVLATYCLVCFTWLFFRADNLLEAQVFLSGIFSWEASPFTGTCIGITLSFVGMTALLDGLMEWREKQSFLLDIPSVALRWGIYAGLLLLTCVYMFVQEPLPFVYFQF